MSPMYGHQKCLSLNASGPKRQPQEDVNPLVFLDRWYSSWDKRYIYNILDYENAKETKPISLLLENMK
jgi:hypothetical protein